MKQERDDCRDLFDHVIEMHELLALLQGSIVLPVGDRVVFLDFDRACVVNDEEVDFTVKSSISRLICYFRSRQ